MISSLKANAELYRVVPTPFPTMPSLEHFVRALTTGKLPMYLTNSLITSTCSAALVTLLALYAGFSFAKYGISAASRSCSSCCRHRCFRSACC